MGVGGGMPGETPESARREEQEAPFATGSTRCTCSRRAATWRPWRRRYRACRPGERGQRRRVRRLGRRKQLAPAAGGARATWVRRRDAGADLGATTFGVRRSGGRGRHTARERVAGSSVGRRTSRRATAMSQPRGAERTAPIAFISQETRQKNRKKPNSKIQQDFRPQAAAGGGYNKEFLRRLHKHSFIRF